MNDFIDQTKPDEDGGLTADVPQPPAPDAWQADKAELAGDVAELRRDGSELFADAKEAGRDLLERLVGKVNEIVEHLSTPGRSMDQAPAPLEVTTPPPADVLPPADVTSTAYPLPPQGDAGDETPQV